jgi:hypothetical protein
MVTVVDYKKMQKEDGQEFYSLVLQGDIDFARSTKTGKFYATARKATLACTFDEIACKQLIGRQIPGKIEKVSTETYDYVIPGTDEVIQLSHTYQFIPVGNEAEQAVFEIE